MAVLGVTAIAVHTTTTRTTAQPEPTGRAAGGGPPPTGSSRRVAAQHHGIAVERPVPTPRPRIVEAPTPSQPVPSVLLRPVPSAVEVVEAPVRPHAPVVLAAAVPPVVPVPSPVVLLAPPPITLRPVPAVPHGAAPVVIPVHRAEPPAVVRRAAPVAPEPPSRAVPVRDPATPVARAGIDTIPQAASRPDASAPAEPLITAAPGRTVAPPAPLAFELTPPLVTAGAGTADQRPRFPAPTGGTAAAADARALQAAFTAGSSVLPGGAAGDADADALRASTAADRRADPLDRRPDGPEAHAVRRPFVGTTTAAETAASARAATDPAAAIRLARDLDAAGQGFSAVAWNADRDSNAAVLRLNAASDWSRHEQERVELFADLRAAHAGLRAQTGFEQAVARRLVDAG